MATFGILCCAIEQRRDSHGRVIVYTSATKYSHYKGRHALVSVFIRALERSGTVQEQTKIFR